jgi:GNAT superfamily N-acetyltransferase
VPDPNTINNNWLSLRRAAQILDISPAARGPSTQVFVATQGESLVGFCSIMPSRDSDAGADVAEITAIYVDPTCWRSGFGTSLLGAAIEFAGQNLAAMALYRRAGFRERDRLRRLDDRRDLIDGCVGHGRSPDEALPRGMVEVRSPSRRSAHGCTLGLGYYGKCT